MKHCPACQQSYTDDGLKFCRADGTLLVIVAQDGSDSPTVQLDSSSSHNDPMSTRVFPATPLPAVVSTTPKSSSLQKESHSVGAIDSLAVLPFRDDGGDPEMEYFGDGVTESIINAISQLPKLRVVARHSVFRFKGQDVDLREVARQLNVRAVLTGRVRQYAGSFVISAELIDVVSDAQLWGERYHRKKADIFEIEAEITREIFAKLRLRLTNTEQQQIAKRSTGNPIAYELLLKGRFYRYENAPVGHTKAIQYYNQAIALDPNYALAFAELSIAYSDLAASSQADPKEVMPKANTAAIKALELDESLPEAHYALGYIKLYDWDWASAEQGFKRAIELNPNHAGAHAGYASLLSNLGRHEEAIIEIKQTREIDPLSPTRNVTVGLILYFARQYDQAVDFLEQVIELNPNYPLAHVVLGYVYTGKGLYAEAIAAYKEAGNMVGNNSSDQCYLGYAYAMLGDYSDAQTILKQLQNAQEYVSPAEMAVLYIGLGDKEKALDALDDAYAKHDLQLQYLACEPHYDRLRADPRFADLVQRLGLPS
jgi:TolB-like protein/Flp pilus assembly protein TadD